VCFALDSQRLTLPDNHRLLTVIDDASGLTGLEQLRLLHWINEHRPQLVSFPPRPIFPLVCEGHFLDTLFYRLNAVTIRLPVLGNTALGIIISAVALPTLSLFLPLHRKFPQDEPAPDHQFAVP
jgi:hypothetical protein